MTRPIRAMRLHILGRGTYLVVYRRNVPSMARATALLRTFFPGAECDYIVVLS